MDFERKFPQLATLKGVVRDFVFRVLYLQHELWWQEDPSPYKTNLYHDPTPEGYLAPTTYMERAIELCGYEITNRNYGLGFIDLMQLDLTTFEDIEKAVHEEAARQAKSLPKLPKDFGEPPKQ